MLKKKKPHCTRVARVMRLVRYYKVEEEINQGFIERVSSLRRLGSVFFP